MLDLKDRTILITGGARGIGKGMVNHFLEIGMRVAFADRDEESGKQTQREYENKGSLHFIRADVKSEQDAENAVFQTVKHYGELFALINNAAIARANNEPMETLPFEEWNRVIQTNLTGVFLISKYAVPYLRATQGAIVNIASTRALQSEPHSEAYAASKGGVVALTHAMALSLGPDIRVNCISPGWIDTSAFHPGSQAVAAEFRDIDHTQHPAGRIGIPNDIAVLASFLLSSQAGFITGQNYIVDGGMTRRMIYAE